MNNNDLAADLRALADKVERLPDTLRLDVALKAYNVESLPELRAMAMLMDTPRPNSNCGYYWLNGLFSPGIEVTAFYQTGLLGPKQSKREIVVVSEETDLSLLEEQDDDHEPPPRQQSELQRDRERPPARKIPAEYSQTQVAEREQAERPAAKHAQAVAAEHGMMTAEQLERRQRDDKWVADVTESINKAADYPALLAISDLIQEQNGYVKGQLRAVYSARAKELRTAESAMAGV